jgi:hypothetical protein
MKSINNALDINDDLEDDIANTIIIEPEDCTFDEANPDNDVFEDYKFIRKKLRFSIAACEKVFENALRDLASNPSPRVVEGCATIIKTITECTGQILDLHTKIKSIKPRKEVDLTVDGENGIKTAVRSSVDEILDEANKVENEKQDEARSV